MAKMVLLNEFISLNGVDISSYVTKAELSWEAESKEVTTFGSNGNKEFIGGLKSGTLAVEFKQDYAASAIDSVMWPLVGTVVPFVVRPTSAVVGTSNPQYSGNVLVTGWNPIGGSVGDDANGSFSYPTTGAVTRATA